MTPVRLEPSATLSPVKHSTSEPLCSLHMDCFPMGYCLVLLCFPSVFLSIHLKLTKSITATDIELNMQTEQHSVKCKYKMHNTNFRIFLVVSPFHLRMLIL